MPAKSEAQRRLMEAVEHNPKIAKKAGIAPTDAKKVLGENDSVSSYMDAVTSGDSARIKNAAEKFKRGQ